MYTWPCSNHSCHTLLAPSLFQGYINITEEPLGDGTWFNYEPVFTGINATTSNQVRHMSTPPLFPARSNPAASIALQPHSQQMQRQSMDWG
jgi:hypothetical protein